MLKKALVGMAAAASFAAPASAVVVINDTITLTQFGNVFVGGIQDDVSDTPDPAFELNYTFSLPVDAFGATQVSTITVGGSSVTFTNVSLNSNALTFMGVNAFGGQVFAINSAFVAAANNLLEIDGTVVGAARIGTEININAVPEPATWAMFILGFGALGFTMRRRNAQVTAAKATLNFA